MPSLFGKLRLNEDVVRKWCTSHNYAAVNGGDCGENFLRDVIKITDFWPLALDLWVYGYCVVVECWAKWALASGSDCFVVNTCKIAAIGRLIIGCNSFGRRWILVVLVSVRGVNTVDTYRHDHQSPEKGVAPWVRTWLMLEGFFLYYPKLSARPLSAHFDQKTSKLLVQSMSDRLGMDNQTMCSSLLSISLRSSSGSHSKDSGCAR